MSIRQAQREIDSAEFAEWLAYNAIEPFGEERADLRAGIVASTIANVNRGKNTKAFKPDDFMPKFGNERKPRQTVEQMKAVLRQYTAVHNQAMANREKRGK